MSAGNKDALFAFKSERKSMYKTHPCVEADTEECTHFAYRGDDYLRHYVNKLVNHLFEPVHGKESYFGSELGINVVNTLQSRLTIFTRSTVAHD